MPGVRPYRLTQFVHADEVPGSLRAELIDCWVTVTNGGGAVGFPFPPVDAAEVAPVADAMLAELDPRRLRLLVGTVDGALAGWLTVRRDLDPLVAHWGIVNRVQTHPRWRGRGVGAALMSDVRRVARDEMDLQQLRLAARDGQGLEGFYRRLGWREIGRWPAALRFGPGDDRDEILMLLAPL
jgi:GNAT superfamily N-acetyltransferase